MILFFCTLCWGKHTKKEVPALIYEIFVIMAVYFLLFYRGRYLYNRVDVGLWLAASLVVLWTMTGENEWFSSRSGILLVAAVLCVSQNTGRRNWKANTEDKYSEMQEEKAGRFFISSAIKTLRGQFTSFLLKIKRVMPARE